MSIRSVLVAVFALMTAFPAQQVNTPFASFGIDVPAETVIGEGPTAAEYWTDSEVVFEAKGVPWQFVAILVGEWFPEAFASGTVVVDIHLPTLSVLMNGFTSLDPAEAIGPTGVASRAIVFPGRERPADQAATMQAIIGDPTAPPWFLHSSGACRMTLRSGYEALDLSDDGTVYVPFREGFEFPFYGTNHPGTWVNANGYLTFESELYEHEASDLPFLSGPPRIAALFCDLAPHLSSTEEISFSQYQEGEEWRVRVKWSEVPGVLTPSLSHTAEVVLSPSGVLTIEVGGACDAPVEDVIVGISPGIHLDVTNVAVDLSALAGSYWYAGPLEAIYEVFDHGNQAGLTNFLDLNGLRLGFYPDFLAPAPSGYSVY